MTDSNALQAKIIEAMFDAFCKKAFWRTGPSEETVHPVRAGITAAFYAQHGLACVVPPKATEEIISASAAYLARRLVFKTMAAAGELTRKPE